ncbi:MAG: amidohydrolase [Thermosediminibacteraceae bacterium]|nr:amidohydrolase [Thermosediminibacteraceae bacterium]
MERIDFLTEARKFEKDMINLRRSFHKNPELGFEEVVTSRVIEEVLQSLGIETKRVAGTGIIGLLKGTKVGKTVALRADMDALPLSDEKKVEYASKVPGKMHACGHDAHMAGLLGAAMILSRFRNILPGNIKFIFQPAEETEGGALSMIKAGVMENPKVDAIFGLHCDVSIDTGKIGVKYGKANAASDIFEVEIYGKSCHGAAPHEGIDAIAIGAQVVTALQSIVSRNVDPLDSAVVTVGVFQGGYKSNIIADRVRLSGIIRSLNPKTRTMLCQRVADIIRGVTSAMGANARIELIPGYPCLINDNNMVDFVKRQGESVLGRENVVVVKEPNMGVEDFAYYLQHAPGAFYRLGVRNEKKGIVHPPHSGLFDIDESSLTVAAAMHAAIAFNFLWTQ